MTKYQIFPIPLFEDPSNLESKKGPSRKGALGSAPRRRRRRGRSLLLIMLSIGAVC